jgi:phosphotriesterase-related protein
MHEHVVTRSPGVAENFPETYPRDAVANQCVRVLQQLKRRFNVSTIVDHSTMDLGRDVEMLAEVSRRSGVQIIACTGLWIEPPAYFDHRSADHAAELFIREVENGVRDTGIRPGIVKCAIDSAGLTPPVEKAIRAAARTHCATGIPVSVHAWCGNHSGETAAELLSDEGVDMQCVLLGHSGDTLDLEYLHRLLATGALLGMDRFGVEDRLEDSERVEVVAQLCREGYAQRLVLSHDASYWSGRLTDEYKASVRPNWYPWRIFDAILPALVKAGVSEAQIELMLVDNPRRFFARAQAADTVSPARDLGSAATASNYRPERQG